MSSTKLVSYNVKKHIPNVFLPILAEWIKKWILAILILSHIMILKRLECDF